MRGFKGFGARAGAITLAFLGVALVAPQVAQAAAWQVNTTADNAPSGSECQGVAGDCSLRQAIDKAASGDTIDVPAGDYVLSAAAGQLSIAKSITITGAGAGSVTIDGNNAIRVFLIQPDASLDLSGVTVTGGSSSGARGGDIDNQGTLMISDSTVSNGSSGFAGGDIASELVGSPSTSPSLTITDSTISGGSGTNQGGGIYIASGTSGTITSSTLTGNQVPTSEGGGGGGLSNAGSNLTITNSAISGNSVVSGGSGGGILDTGSDTTITGSTISGNSAPGVNGGGIDAGGTNLTITNSTISGNSVGSSGLGGGIYDDEVGTTGLTVVNTTIGGNTAAANNGANVYFNFQTGGFQNTIIANPLGGGSNCNDNGDGPLASAGHNLEDDAAVSCGFNTASDLTPADPKLGALANNGGPTQTMALLAGSPAIDAGATVAGVTTDQRGGARPQPAGGAPDIGAYEVGALVDTSISMGGSPNPVTVGQPLTYTLTATNNGPAADPAFAVQTVDSLPAGVTLQSVTPSQGSCTSTSTSVTCHLGTVAKGAPATVTIVVVPQSIGTLTNSATVASSGTDPSPSNNSASVNTDVQNAPIVSTDLPSGVSQAGATLNGTVNPQNQSTTYFFQYGTDTSYGSQVPATPALVGSDATGHAVSQALSGLEPNQTYHYRVVATNATGTSFGADRSFTTLPAAPIAVTDLPSGVSQAGATLNGTVNPQNQSTTYFFQYGTDTSYGSQVPATPALVGSDATAHAVSQALSGLAPNQTYHYRVVATNDTGTSFGADQSFTTGAVKPIVSTDPGSGVSQTGATLNGRVNPQNAVTTYYFQYGTSTSYGSRVPASGVTVGSDATAHAVLQALSGLAPNQTYHYRVVATNAAGTSFGADQMFTTSPAPPIAVTDPGSGFSQKGVTVNGRVNPQNQSTTYYFQYGTSTSYGLRVPATGVPVGSDATDHQVSESLSGLAPNQTYHYRVVATNATGTSLGGDRTFTTRAAKPIVVTDPGSGVSQTAAKLNGRVNPQNSVTTYYFQYGSTTKYGSQTQSSRLPSGLSTLPVSLDVSGLHPGTRYHYRLVAVNPAGTTVGGDHTFFTYFFPSLHVSPSVVQPGDPLKVYGNAGDCPAGSTLTLLSPAFSFARTYNGQGAIYTTVEFHGFFSTTTRIPSDRHRGTYPVSGLCGRFPAAGARDAATAGVARSARGRAGRRVVWSSRLAVS